MADKTKIQWCDHSASPWYGCAHVHAGCDHCYAEALAKRNPTALGIWGDGGTRVKSKSFLANLRKWNRKAQEAGRVVSVFPSLCDPFEDRPELEPWRREMFQVIDECPSVRLLLLTKRPKNVRRMWPRVGFPESGIPGTLGRYVRLPNVWLLASVSDQATADALVPELLKCRDLVPVLGLSCEPLLGEIDFSQMPNTNGYGEGQRWYDPLKRLAWYATFEPYYDGCHCKEGIDFVIVGGESGPNARPCNVEWVRSLVGQCRAAAVPVFVKQLGARPYFQSADMHGPQDLWLSDPKGGDPAEWSEDLRVREFPTVEVFQ